MAVEQKYPQECPIWETPAKVEIVYNKVEINSPRASGKYQIWYPDVPPEDVLEGFKKKLADDKRVEMTDWLIEQREKGVVVPEIKEGVLRHIKTRREKAMSERIKSLMIFLAKEHKVGDMIIDVAYGQDSAIDSQDSAMMLMAYSSSSSAHSAYEASSFLTYCISEGYLEQKKSHSNSSTHYAMTVRGKIYAEEIIKEDKQKRQCFVAMWFDKETDDAYEKAIIPAIEDAGYKPYRVDKDHHNGKIDDLIIAEIRNSRFIIADFTSKPKEPRGGVYFEAGFAYGLEIPVIWTCRKDLIDDIHFDTRQYNHILWDDDNLPDFRKRIYYSIGKNVGWSEDVKAEDTSSSK